MENQKTRIAIAYDFDGTLARGSLPEHGLLQDLGIESVSFWNEVKERAETQDADEILAYMCLLLEKAKELGIEITESRLGSYAANIPFFEGVVEWFGRIDKYAAELGVGIDHFVISSGLREIIAASAIAPCFKFVFASKYLYDERGMASYPAVSINYTTKTQYLFRINKGIFNFFDNKRINTWIRLDRRPYPFKRMIYIGDGDTDIPAMKMTRYQGGYSIAVFDPLKWDDLSQQAKIYKLIAEDRVQYVAPAVYSEGSLLDIAVKGIIGKIANEP